MEQNNQCDVMILNFWSVGNYGAFLTCWGVQALAESLGLNVKVIKYIPSTKKTMYETSFPKTAGEKYLNLTEEVNDYTDFINLNNSCKIFISGSDQIFNYGIDKSLTPDLTPFIFLLDFVKSSAKKLTYAGSFGYETFSSGGGLTRLQKLILSII